MATNAECGVRFSRTKANASRMSRALDWLRAALARRRLRARLRADLQQLDAHLLHDIGARREDLLEEAHRPFWRE